MKNGFSVRLNIGGRLLEYDDNAGLLTCKIPRQMMEDPTKLSFGIISQQAQVTLEDFDNKLRKLVLKKQINTTTKGEIYYNDNLIFYGFVNESSYNDDDNTLELKIADPLILLSSYKTPSLVKKISSPIILLNDLITFIKGAFNGKGIRFNINIDQYTTEWLNSITTMVSSNKYYNNHTNDIRFIKGDDLWSSVNNFCVLTLINMYYKDDILYIGRVAV